MEVSPNQSIQSETSNSYWTFCVRLTFLLRNDFIWHHLQTECSFYCYGQWAIQYGSQAETKNPIGDKTFSCNVLSPIEYFASDWLSCGNNYKYSNRCIRSWAVCTWGWAVWKKTITALLRGRKLMTKRRRMSVSGLKCSRSVEFMVLWSWCQVGIGFLLRVDLCRDRIITFT